MIVEKFSINLYKEFIRSMSTSFDVARAKNMYGYDEERAAQQLHYRTIMLNVVWYSSFFRINICFCAHFPFIFRPPKEGDFPRTFGELEAKSGEMWDDYVETLPKEKVIIKK